MFARKILVLSWALFLLFSIVGGLDAQPTGKHDELWTRLISGQAKRFAAFIDDNGRVELTIVGHAEEFGIRFEPFEFYGHASVKSELELTGGVANKFDSILANWKERREKGYPALNTSSAAFRTKMQSRWRLDR